MKQRLMRPTAALFPMIGLLGALSDGETRDFLLLVFLFYYLMQLCGLCAADCFRNAAAREPSVRRVDRRFGGALLPLLFGIAVVWAAILLLRPAALDGTDHAALLFGLVRRAGIAAGFIFIEHLFEERMFALGRRIDGIALSCVCNGLLLAGMLLDMGGTGRNLYFTGAAALGALASAVLNYLIEPCHGFSLRPQNLRFAPSACLQTLLYPAVAVATTLLLSNGDGAKLEAAIPAFFFGLIPWRLARTTARRTQDESRPLNLLLILFASIPSAASTWLPAVQPYALAATLALICAAAVFCAPSPRLYTGIALIAASLLPISHSFYINAILALAAVAINVKKTLRKKK